MRIIILGGGHVGSALAEQLVNAQNEITVVDQDADCLRQLQEKFDLRVLEGHAAHPEVLQEAGAQTTEALVAVTSSDEVNMIACQISYALFKTPRRIAHIRSQAYLAYQEQLFNSQTIPICQVITPEQLVAEHIYQLIVYPGALQLLSFMQGKVGLLVLKADSYHPLVNAPLSILFQQIAANDACVIAIIRKKQLLMSVPTTTIIEAGDELFLVVAFEHLPAVIASWHGLEKPYKHKRLIIAGGGNVGAALAKRLEQAYSVKLIERNPKRAAALATMLPQTIVLCGSAFDQALLSEEHIEQSDLFIAVTNYDEDNIMSAMLAKHLGAKKSLVLIQRSLYADVIQDGVIDLIISPQQVTLAALLVQLRKSGSTTRLVHSLKQGAAIVELQVQGGPTTSEVVGQRVNQIKLPSGVSIIARARGDICVIADDHLPIQEGEHLLLFLKDKDTLAAVEGLFELVRPSGE